eukprot:COSAG02_NODE_592_length_19856_cov_19.262793_1_plen_86_part_00
MLLLLLLLCITANESGAACVMSPTESSVGPELTMILDWCAQPCLLSVDHDAHTPNAVGCWSRAQGGADHPAVLHAGIGKRRPGHV